MAYISSTADRYRNRAKSDALPQRSYAEWSDQGLMPARPTHTNPFSDSSHYILEEENQDYLSRRDQVKSMSDDAPELFVSETTSHILPQVNGDGQTEEALLRRYGLDNVDLNQLGGIGQVCTSKDTGHNVVVKRVIKSYSDDSSQARREIAILSTVSDASIPSLVEWLELDNAIWSITENREGKPIGQIIRSRGAFSEDMTKSFMNQLFSATASLFLAGYAHLRICDETLYLDSYSQLIIKDFQYACEFGKDREDDLYAVTQEKYASDLYVAPEVFANRRYNARKAVIWSCGIILYFITTGQTEKLSNLDHPSFDNLSGPESQVTNDDSSSTTNSSSTPETSQQQPSSSKQRRKHSISVAQPRIIHYPNRFAAPSFAREIIPKMLIQDPRRRAELIEVCSRVPKDYSTKETRPLMEVAWLDYKHHVGPYAGLHLAENDYDQSSASRRLSSSASSIMSAASKMSNPFGSLLGRKRDNNGPNATASSRRKSAPVYAGFV